VFHIRFEIFYTTVVFERAGKITEHVSALHCR